MSASFHNLQQEITKIGNVINSQKFLPKTNSREFPLGIFDVADSRTGIPGGLVLQLLLKVFLG